MNVLNLIMYLLAFVCFLLAAFGSPRLPGATVNMTALGLAFFVVPALVAAIRTVTG